MGLPLARSTSKDEWSPKEYRLVTQRPQFVYLRLLASASGGGNLRVEHLATEEKSMEDGYPHQSVDTSQRDYQDLLASFRRVTEERNALRSDVERLHETLAGVRDAQSPRSRLHAM